MGEWRLSPLFSLADYINGRATKPSEAVSDGLPVVRIAELNRGITPSTLRVPPDNVLPRHRIVAGDLLFAWSGSIGIYKYSGPDAALNQHIFNVRATQGNDQDFLRYLLLYCMPQFQQCVDDKRTTMGHVTIQDLQSMQVSVPPLSEQRAIAELLGALDDKIEANRRVVQLFLSHVAATWRLHFQSVSTEWPECPIGEVVRVVGGSTPRTSVEAFWDGDIAWATPRDLSRLPSLPLLTTERRITDLGLQQISSGLLPRGTVLLSSRAPIGYLAIAEVPLAVNQGFIALVPGERLPGLYLWQWLSHNLDEILSRANGTTFLEVSKANFRPMPISLPPRELVKAWFELAESMYAAIVGKEVESNALVQLRDALLPKLLSGELRVRDAESLIEEAV